MKRLIEQTACDHGQWEKCPFSEPCGEAHTYVKACGTDCSRCLGGSSRVLTVDYEAGARITRELISLLPVEFEGSHDATVWTLKIVDKALGGGG